MCQRLCLKGCVSKPVSRRLCVKACVSKVVFQKLCLKGCVSKVVSQRLCLKASVSKVVSQSLCLKACVSKPVSQSLCLKGCVSKPMSQSLCLKACVLKVVFQKLCLKACVSKHVSQRLCLIGCVSKLCLKAFVSKPVSQRLCLKGCVSKVVSQSLWLTTCKDALRSTVTSLKKLMVNHWWQMVEADVEVVMKSIHDPSCIYLHQHLTTEGINMMEPATEVPEGWTFLRQLPEKVQKTEVQELIVMCFNHLSEAHTHMLSFVANMSSLAKITNPETFNMVMKAAARPMIQINVPEHYLSLV